MPVSTTTHAIERAGPDGVGLSVSCEWIGDRFHHRLEWFASGRRECLLSSCEGGPNDDWPPSPPLQQVLQQTVQGYPALLGVGMAGNSHWSASYVLRHQPAFTLQVQLACALGAGNESAPAYPGLRVTYDCHVPAHLETVANGSDNLILCPSSGPRLLLSCDDQAGDSPSRLEFDGRRLTIHASSIANTPTVQWSFQLAVAALPGGHAQVSS